MMWKLTSGAMRSAPNAPRTLDLDLIDYDGRVEQGAVELPHPRMTERSFVLVPLAEIAPGWRHPVSGQELAEALLAALPDRDAPNFYCLAGIRLILAAELFCICPRCDPRKSGAFRVVR